VIDATSLEADGIQLTQNGGLGADVFIGSEGDDLVNGGDGDDTAFLAAGDDTFVWNPGDDNDTLEGQAGFDRMLFNGSNAAETINLQANGGRVLFTRDIASVVMDLNDVEQTDFTALGGVDRVTVGDLSGTDMAEVNTNLAGAGGVDDAAGDTVFATGTNGDDVAVVAGGGGQASAFGLAAQVNVTGATAGSDRLAISLLAGDDVADASGLQASGPLLSVDGGDDDDVIIGGDGDDTLLGGDGDDVILGGPGNDVIDGGLGENVVIQSLGADTTAAAAVTGEEWLETHADTVGGETVLEVGGEERTLPEADLADLAAGAV
jgi:Ca2+-binding RTX toxin-like protein